MTNLQISDYKDYKEYAIAVLMDKFYDKLEDDCVEFTCFGEDGFEYIKEQYADTPLKDVIDYLFKDGWVKDWTESIIL